MSMADAPPRRLTLSVMGHVDHGKTALVRALTGMETDRLPEEQRRGVSIALGFAHAAIGGVEVDFIDMPGHERFVRTMVSGATGIEAALLVVAANEGVKPQTREHLDIAALLGLRHLLPVLSKSDLVSAEAAKTVGEEVEAAVAAAGLASVPAIAVSALSGYGLGVLRTAIAGLAEEVDPGADDGFPCLPIDRAFTMEGLGTVVTGTLRRGRLELGQPLVLEPGGRAAPVRGLQVHGRPVTTALPGQRVAVNLRGVSPDDARRGLTLGPPGALEASRRLGVTLRAVAGAPPLKTGAHLVLMIGTAEVPARLRLLDRERLEPGETVLAQVETLEDVAAAAREHFVLRRPSPALTIAGGEVLDPAAARLRRHDAAALATLEGLNGATPREAARRTLKAAAARGAPLRRLALLAGQTAERIADTLMAAGARRLANDLMIDGEALADLGAAVLETLRSRLVEQPNGMARRRLDALLPAAAPEAMDAALAELAGAGRLALVGGVVRLAPGRADAQAQARQAAVLVARMAERLRDGGLAPPDLADIAPGPAERRILEHLLKSGVAVKTLDRVQKREVAFHRDAVASARDRLALRLGPPGLTVGEAGALLGMTRKFSVPLLEHLDAMGFTRRAGDRRVLGPRADG